jgi:hypothetical protein
VGIIKEPGTSIYEAEQSCDTGKAPGTNCNAWRWTLDYLNRPEATESQYYSTMSCLAVPKCAKESIDQDVDSVFNQSKE